MQVQFWGSSTPDRTPVFMTNFLGNDAVHLEVSQDLIQSSLSGLEMPFLGHVC